MSEVQEQTILKSTEALKHEAERIVKRKTLYAAGVGLLPFPVVDTALILGIQITMTRSISQVYEVEFKENIVKSIIGSLVGSIGTSSVIKAIPGAGLLGGLTSSVVAASATYALGKVFIQHFAQGGTLLNFDPVQSREFFEKEFEAGRLYVADVAEVEQAVEKEKSDKGGLFGFFTGKKKKQEEAERQELLQTNKELAAAIAHLREEVSALKPQ